MSKETVNMDWKLIKIPGVARVDRIVARFEIWSDGTLPFAKFQVKIVERAGGDFLGVANVAIRDLTSSEPSGISGLGDSIEEALKDALEYFFEEVEQNAPDRPLTENDFEWADPSDF